MEREQNQFSAELLQMMREEEREKFLAALKEGASWGQLYQIRNTIRRLNKMIEDVPQDMTSSSHISRSEEPGPRE